MRFGMFLVLGAALSASTGCVSSIDEGCANDSQCYDGRVCLDGHCSADRLLSENSENQAPNNSSNNAQNNANNPVNNHQDNINNPQNNDVRVCEIAADCPGDKVCTAPVEADQDDWACVDPWMCESAGISVEVGNCFVEFECEGGDALFNILCDYGDTDTAYCVCRSPNGLEADFEVPSTVCSDQVSLINTMNTRCGWRFQP